MWGLARQATVPAPIFCSQHHFLNVTLGLVRGAEPYGTSQAGNPQAAVAPGGYAVCHELQATSPLPIITDALGTNLQPPRWTRQPPVMDISRSASHTDQFWMSQVTARLWTCAPRTRTPPRPSMFSPGDLAN